RSGQPIIFSLPPTLCIGPTARSRKLDGPPKKEFFSQLSSRCARRKVGALHEGDLRATAGVFCSGTRGATAAACRAYGIHSGRETHSGQRHRRGAPAARLTCIQGWVSAHSG